MEIIMPNVIAAISTPLAPGGIGVIRISGAGALTVADKVFFTKNKNTSKMFFIKNTLRFNSKL